MDTKFYWQIIHSVTKTIFAQKITRSFTLESSKKGFSLIIISIVIAVFLVLLAGISWKFWSGKTTPEGTTSPNSSLFGTMIAFNINEAPMNTPGIIPTLRKGWTQFRKDHSAYENLKSNLKKLIQDRTKLVKATGFFLDRGFDYFTWNVIEPQKGQFDWELTDIYVRGASNAGVKISAVVQPFASWDQKNTSPLANCNALDFAFYDYKAGPPNDLTEYKNFLTKTVERYKDNVAVWEIGNEYDSPCGGYENDPQGYFDLLKISSETIKKADPNAKVTNGGTSDVSYHNVKNFWRQFFSLGGGRYIDYFNTHYNVDRSQDATLSPAAFQEGLAFFNDLMDKNGGRKPLYLTEFGIYSGSPSSQPPGQLGQGPSQAQANSLTQQQPPEQSFNQPQNGKCGDGICDAFEKQNSNACPQDCGGNVPGGNSGQLSGKPIQGQATGQNIQSNQGQTLHNLSENDQAILYFKDSIIAFASGAKIVFIDLIGPDNSLVGSSMAFNTDSKPRLFLATLKMIDHKISGFSKVEKVADGQYKFIVKDKPVYALWSGKMPAEITGQVTITRIDDSQAIEDAAYVSLSTEPIIVLRN